MPLSKSGSYHANPATAAMHDHAAIPDPGEQEQAGSAHAVEIHAPNHPETGDGQNFHVRVHHADGQAEESKHATFDEAAQHGAQALGAGNEAEPSDDAGESEEDDNDSDDEY